MTDSLRDQLLGLGFKPAPKPARDSAAGPRPQARPGRPGDARPGDRRGGDRRPGGHASAARKPDDARSGERKPKGAPPPSRGPRRGGKPGAGGDIDLAKAYAIRAQREKDERIEAERRKQEEARLRREARARLATFLEGKALNAADADIARHFPYGGKIKRIYVTQAQLGPLNAGELGVVQLNGRYLLLSAGHLAEAESIFAESVALKVDPDAPAGDDPYADPQYQVPDDLVW